LEALRKKNAHKIQVTQLNFYRITLGKFLSPLPRIRKIAKKARNFSQIPEKRRESNRLPFDKYLIVLQ